jgi:type II secretory pathway pseudopilin PulG
MSHRRRGFTLVELSLGIAFTAMIGAAVATFLLAVSAQWKSAETQQHFDVTIQQGSQSIGSIIQSARRVGGTFNDEKPSIFIWESDRLKADGIAQFGEMAVIEFDPQLESIFYYRANAASNLLVDLLAGLNVAVPQMLEEALVQLFTQQAWLEPRRVLLGPGRQVAADVMMTRVTDATFTKVAGRDGVQVEITLTRGEDLVLLRDYYSVRNPADQPPGNGVGF